MADNDEYQFDDLDAITPSSGDENETPETPVPGSEEMPPVSSGDNQLKRNILIVVAIFILILVVYKFIESSATTKPVPVAPSVPAVTAPIMPVQPQPEMPIPQVVTPAAEVKINQALSTIEISQQSLRTDVSSVNNQLNGVNSNLTAMMAKITELNGIITNLSTKIDEEAIIIEKLTARREPKKIHRVTHRINQRPKFYIQAVIPGRAWLIATNGTTLTVREGTAIAGYGIVKLIDPDQGRVMTSSGQVIRFSQEDS